MAGSLKRDLPSHEAGESGSISESGIVGPFARSAAGNPSTYMRYAPPDAVSATCFQMPSGSCVPGVRTASRVLPSPGTPP
jgi:hypothetical protein